MSQLGPFLADNWRMLLPTLLGMAAVYLLLPRARRYPPLWGGLLGGVALVLAALLLLNPTGLSVETVLFYAFAGLAVGGGVMMLAHSNPVYAALSFALVVLSTCGLFLLLAAPFLMAATIIIYAGAIIVTFLFVIMLAQQWGFSDADLRSREPFFAAVTGFLLLGALLWVLGRTYDASPPSAVREFVEKARRAGAAGTPEQVKQILGDDPAAQDGYFRNFERAVAEGDKASKKPPREEEELVNLLQDTTTKTVWQQMQDVQAMALELKQVHEAGTRYLAYLRRTTTPGVLATDNRALSGLSAAPRDEKGNPRMPANNVAALGRSLYSDYLLPVQLAAALLLVATIGAIAIAGRRTEGLR
jgi:NADH:ubiquinone oxidoreductase subunit 6 (subunit J)